MFSQHYVENFVFTWEPPLEPPIEYPKCEECGDNLSYGRFGQIIVCSCEDGDEY